MSKLTLRTQPTCPHCLNDDGHSAILRYATIDGNGVSSTCAGCGTDLGDAKELTVPTNVVGIYTTLIGRAAMRVRYFNKDLPTTVCLDPGKQLVPVKLDQISFASRAAHGGTVQCTLDWQAFDPDIGTPRPEAAVNCDVLKRIETFPPAVALAVKVFLNDGFTVIQIPREGAEDGVMRFRKIGAVHIDRDQEKWSEHTIIRGQLNW